jgi:aspartyl-tRNA(Asn)/glutamyl-tRNA(Gln) amidotransferase subunit A
MQTVMAEAARERAKQADEELARGEGRGPLHGIPIAVKDLFRTKGVRTTGGSKLFEDHVPDHDATVVEWLRAGGAVLVGKTGMHELAYGITSSNPHFGAVRNPWDRDRIPGGSSGGSGAAVAAGMVSMAMGSDTGGSIRIPAAFCGVVGLKPTYGRVSRYGAMPLAFTLDHMGPAHPLRAGCRRRAQRDRRIRSARRNIFPPPRRELRAGYRAFHPRPAHRLAGELLLRAPRPGRGCRRARRLQAAESRGAEIVPLRVPDIAAINTVARVILLAEASALLEPHLEQRDQFGADVLALLDQGRLLPATDYINAQRLRRAMQREFARLWSRVDCLFTPTTPSPRRASAKPQLRSAAKRRRAPGRHPPGARHQPAGLAGGVDSVRRGPPRPAHRVADRRPALRRSPYLARRAGARPGGGPRDKATPYNRLQETL